MPLCGTRLVVIIIRIDGYIYYLISSESSELLSSVKATSFSLSPCVDLSRFLTHMNRADIEIEPNTVAAADAREQASLYDMVQLKIEKQLSNSNLPAQK